MSSDIRFRRGGRERSPRLSGRRLRRGRLSPRRHPQPRRGVLRGAPVRRSPRPRSACTSAIASARSPATSSTPTQCCERLTSATGGVIGGSGSGSLSIPLPGLRPAPRPFIAAVVPSRLQETEYWGPSVVMSEDVTRARGSNPAGVPPFGCFGRSAPCGLTQGSLRRAVKFGDREDGLRVIANRLVSQRAGP